MNLADHLRALGLKPGQLVIVHGSLKRGHAPGWQAPEKTGEIDQAAQVLKLRRYAQIACDPG